MAITSTYPVLMSSDVAHAAKFYVDYFGFEPTFSSDWYVSLRHGDFELAILDQHHETIPLGYTSAPAGILFNIEVNDVDAVYTDLVATRGLGTALELRDETFGQRHFILIGPDNVLIDVIEPIDPSPEFQVAYADPSE